MTKTQKEHHADLFILIDQFNDFEAAFNYFKAHQSEININCVNAQNRPLLHDLVGRDTETENDTLFKFAKHLLAHHADITLKDGPTDKNAFFLHLSVLKQAHIEANSFTLLLLLHTLHHAIQNKPTLSYFKSTEFGNLTNENFKTLFDTALMAGEKRILTELGITSTHLIFRQIVALSLGMLGLVAKYKQATLNVLEEEIIVVPTGIFDEAAKTILSEAVMLEYANHAREIVLNASRKKPIREMFASIVLFCDDILRFMATEADDPTGENAKMRRYMRIAAQLPLELQMVLCNRTYGSAKDPVLHDDSEFGFRSVVKRFSTSSTPAEEGSQEATEKGKTKLEAPATLSI